VATLPAQVAAAAARDFERMRNESADLQLVKRRAWELLAATEIAQSFAVWAVGVMYSVTGERRVVALSQHGAGYVPPGVAMPPDVVMVWSDSVIDESFRCRWTGNLDAAATLIAYAESKAAEPQEWRLAAAATTWIDVTALKNAAAHWNTEWAVCSAATLPTPIRTEIAAAAGAVHRLAREFPELAVQVTELRPRGLDLRVARAITDELVELARLLVVDQTTMLGGCRFPENFDAVWPAAAEGRVAPAERVAFAEAVAAQWLSVSMVQPGWDPEPAMSMMVSGEYGRQWIVSRALEVVLGWIADESQDFSRRSSRPELPLADMVYAAIHAHLDGSGAQRITELLARAGF
jgi:hypothetical protein